MKKKCLNCNKEFNVTPYFFESRKFCSNKCYIEYPIIIPKTKFKHEFEIKGDVVIIYWKDREILVDKENFELVDKYNWFVANEGYARTHMYENNIRKIVQMHRLITNCPKGLLVDHINHNTLDNRNINLRICNDAENSHNVNMHKDNKSGAKGICKVKNNKWQAHIGLNRKRKYLGTFGTMEKAIQARKEAEIKYYGEYANV